MPAPLGPADRKLTRAAYDRVAAGRETIEQAATRLGLTRNALQLRWRRAGLGGDPTGYRLTDEDRRRTQEAFDRVAQGLETSDRAAERLGLSSRDTLIERWSKAGLGDPNRVRFDRETRVAYMSVILCRATVDDAAARLRITSASLRERFRDAGFRQFGYGPKPEGLPTRRDPRRPPRADTVAAYTLIRLGHSTAALEGERRGIGASAMQTRINREGLRLTGHGRLPADPSMARWAVALEADAVGEWCDRIVRERDVPDRLIRMIAPALTGLPGLVEAAAPALAEGERPLTPMQTLVLQGLADGKTEPKIAEALSLSIHTVRTHARHLKWALGASSTAQAAAIGLRRGLVSYLGSGDARGYTLADTLAQATQLAKAA